MGELAALGEELAGACSPLSSDQRQLAEGFIAEFGMEAFELAMRAGPLLTGMRPGSRWAFNSALGAIESEVPIILLTRVNKAAKRAGERVEMRLVSGDAQLTVDFPPVS